MIRDSILEQFSPFLLGFCDCGCGGNLKTLKNHNKIITHFILGHGIRTKDRKGFNHPNYINGRMKDNDGYWRITIPGYHGVDDHNRIREHVYNFQEFNKCCILPWGSIHHIDGNRENNMPWNLKGVMRSQHTRIHFLGNLKDRTGYQCFECGSNKTEIKKPNGTHKTSREDWRHLPWDKKHWYCKKCYKRLTRRDKSYRRLKIGGP